jgi:hypothetical protein
MKSLSIFLGLFLTSVIIYAQKTIDTRIDSSFKLSYISVGLGGNMYEMQPMFRVKGSQFIYTLEEAWQFKNVKKAKPDTLYVGNLRTSSIDSILSIATEIKGDSVYKLNAGVMSGGIIYLDILSNQRKLNFELDNSYDLTAKKIVDILNSYIPDKYRKLWISNIAPTISKIK